MNPGSIVLIVLPPPYLAVVNGIVGQEIVGLRGQRRSHGIELRHRVEVVSPIGWMATRSQMVVAKSTAQEWRSFPLPLSPSTEGP